MFKKKTLFVVGAGASHEVGLPTADLLKGQIRSALNTQFDNKRPISRSPIFSALERATANVNPYVNAARRICDALPHAPSIDDLLNDHQDDKQIELCGKLAIAHTIVEAEKDSALYIDPHNTYNTLNGPAVEPTWFGRLMHLLTTDCRLQDVQERLSTIAFIVFNYDRCIEHFLFNALREFYGITAERAAELVNGVSIYHPYDTVGRLGWQSRQGIVDFGGGLQPAPLLEVAKQLRTFSESTDPKSSDIDLVRRLLVESDIIVFLGFAFHKINLNFLKLEHVQRHTSSSNVRYYATAFGLSENDCRSVTTDLSQLAGVDRSRIAVERKLKCAELFSEYRRTFSRL